VSKIVKNTQNTIILRVNQLSLFVRQIVTDSMVVTSVHRTPINVSMARWDMLHYKSYSICGYRID
jgi:hypothetical protein